MEDVLTVIRQYNIQKKEIITEGDRAVFGELSWPKSAETNYVVSGTGKKGQPKQYYTLDSVLFLLTNERLAHPSYVLLATAERVPVVRKPDRKAMLSYLNGESSTLASIGGSAFPEMDLQRLTIETESSPSSSPDELASSPDEAASSPDEAASSPRAKRTRVEDEERPAERECPAVRLEAHRQGTDRIGSLPGATTSVENECSDADVDDLDNRFGGTPAGSAFHNVVTLKNRRFVDAAVTTAQGNVSREIVWGCRTTVLQSTKNEDFSKNILAILQSVRAKEKKEQNATRADPSARKNQPVSAERLTGKAQTQVFNVDTAECFYEDTILTSMTVGASANSRTPTTPASPQPLPRPGPQSRVHLPKRQNRTSRTPIIVVPAGSMSLITMANAKDLLQEATFVTAEEKRRRGIPRDKEVLLQHRKDSSTATVPYRVTDQPLKLAAQDWERVVAVFVQGPAWQFKGWPRLLPEGSPADIFAEIPAFHLKYDEAKTVANVQLWDVTVLEVSRHQRHLDQPTVLRFWETLDRHMVKHKPHLRY